MKLVISGDWQAGVSNLERCRIHVKQIIERLKKSKENTFYVHLGDIKEKMNPVDQREINFIIESLREIRSVCSGIFFVRGNHDSITTQDGVPSCIPVVTASGAIVADEDWTLNVVRLITWNPRIVKYALIYMVPYFRERERQLEAFQKAAGHVALCGKEYHDPTCEAVGKDNIKILFFHNTITGCKQNLYTKGDGYTAADIGADLYDMCISGHIHVPQKLKPNIVYCGSPFPQDWGEINIEHRFLELTIDEGKP